MKRSKFYSVVALGAAVAMSLAACATSAPKEEPSKSPDASTSSDAGETGGEEVELTFMSFETPAVTAAFWDTSIADALKDLPGLKINRIISPDADRNAYAKKLQASGQFPDLLASIATKDFEAAGLLAPYDQAWLDENFLDPRGAEINGKSYITPTSAQIIPLVYYNKTIFKDNGIEVPKNYAEFVAAVEKLAAANVTPIELAGAEPWAASMPIVGLASADVLGKNPDWIKERYAGTTKFTDPEFAGATSKPGPSTAAPTWPTGVSRSTSAST